MSIPHKALIILTSTAVLGDTGRKTGFYFEEMATPYWTLSDAGYEVEIASIKGGPAPHDPSSLKDAGERPPAVERFVASGGAMAKLGHTLPIAEVSIDPYAAFVLPGGHGTMWDFAQSEALAKIIGAGFDAGRIIAAVCHGPSGLVSAKRADGRSILYGKRVNAFTDAEEEACGLTGTVPFLLESRMRELGGVFENSGVFQPHVTRDGNLITGQNPKSTQLVSAAIIDALRGARTAAA